VVQQVGTPDEIYERPRNMFVASFLGNPPINFLEGRLVREGDAVLFQRGALRVPLVDPLATALRPHEGREVVLGLRAEDVVESAASAPQLRGRIVSVLPVGSDRFVELEVEGTKVFLRLGKEAQLREGEQAALGLNVHRLHVFDQASTHNLVWI
jgi:multiple sugar transport system ATP-binding protein